MTQKPARAQSAEGTMRPVAILFFSATLAVAALLTTTASLAVSPFEQSPVQFAAR